MSEYFSEDILSIADYRRAEEETYAAFFRRLLEHQTRHLVQDGSGNCAISSSHINLICVLWLQKIHVKLPQLVQMRFGEQLRNGVPLVTLVPLLTEEMASLLTLLDSDDYDVLKIKADSRDVPFHFLGTDASHFMEPIQSMQIKDEQASDLKTFPKVDSNSESPESEGACTEVTEIKLEIPQEDQEGAKSEEETLEPETRKKVIKKKKPLVEGDEVHYCNRCDYKSNRLKSYRIHIRRAHEDEQYYCSKCKILFNTRPEIVLHRIGHRKERRRQRENQTFQCVYCDFSCKKLEALKGHEFKKHQKGVGFSCDQCDYRSILEYRLKQHILSVHEGIKGSVCYQCGASYSRKGDLDKHIRVKHEGVRYLCDQCDFRTVQPDVLRRHVKHMHGDKLFACEQCDFKAACRLHLRNHMITVHEDVQIYPCDLCDYNARRPVLLKEHKQSKHLGIRFSCKLCDYKSTRKWHMKRHMLKKHDMPDSVDIEDPRP